MMKKCISVIISISLIITLISGCSKENNITAVPSRENSISVTTANIINESSHKEAFTASSESAQKGEVNTEDNIHSAVSSEAYTWTYEPKYSGLSDEELMQRIEDSTYLTLISELNDGNYVVENVSTSYVSQEYLRELTYNSRENNFFGYSLTELDSFFEGARYTFTVDEGGNTIVEALQTISDRNFEKILTDVAVGTGVILVCVTVSCLTAGVAGVEAVNMIFAVAAKTGAVCAVAGAFIGGASAGIVRGYQTGDINEALHSAVLDASEGFRSGAITGVLSGAAAETLGLYRATRLGTGMGNGKGLTMNQVAKIQKESNYPLSIISQFHTYDEYLVFKDANLHVEELANRITLVRPDIDLYNVYDEYNRNNLKRLSVGLNPIDSLGNPFEWHHIGQENNKALALLTKAEHDSNALHGFKVLSEINRTEFNKLKVELNKDLLRLLLNS